MAQTGDPRFTVPLYSVSEAARYLGVPQSTFTTWARGYVRRRPTGAESVGAPVVTTVREQGSIGAVVPFVGLAEGLVLAAFRGGGVPLQRIRPALRRLEDELGVAHALASRALYTDGAEVLYDYAEAAGDTPEARSARELVVVRNGQRVFADIVDAYLHRVDYGPDGYPRVIRLPQYHEGTVVVDPDRGFGQPVFERGGARVEDVMSLFRAGEPLDIVSAEFGVPQSDLQDALRAALQSAA
jgi:uncharacterized protein (DUF433 family)